MIKNYKNFDKNVGGVKQKNEIITDIIILLKKYVYVRLKKKSFCT